METTSYAIYSRSRDAFGAEYHTAYSTNRTLEQAQSEAREASTWQTPGTTLIIVKEVKTIELLDGPEFRFEAMPRAGLGNGQVPAFNDWDN